MRVGIIGLGDIARKAYLPVLAATPGDHAGAGHPDARHAGRGGRPPPRARAPHVRRRRRDRRRARRRVRPHAVRDPPRDRRPAAARGRARCWSTSRSPPTPPRRAPSSRWRGPPGCPSWSASTAGTRPPSPSSPPGTTATSSCCTKHRSHPLGPARDMVFDDFVHVVDTVRYLVPVDPGRPDHRRPDDRRRRLPPARGAVHRRGPPRGRDHELDRRGRARARSTSSATAGGARSPTSRTSSTWPAGSGSSGATAGRRRRGCAASRPCARPSSPPSATACGSTPADALVTHELCERVVEAAERDAAG